MPDIYSELNLLASDADAAFAAGDEAVYEELNEQIRDLVDAYPKLAAQAEDRGVLGGGPNDDDWINRAYQAGAVGNERTTT